MRTNKNYKVYYVNHEYTRSHDYSAETKEEALNYITAQTENKVFFGEEDTDSKNWYGHTAHYEIYEGSPFIYDKNGVYKGLAKPIFMSRSFYCDRGQALAYKLPAPTVIASLSDMGEALMGHEDYPWEWVEDVCNAHDWLNLSECSHNDADICTDGKCILFWNYDRNNVFVAETRDVEDWDLENWEEKISEFNDAHEYAYELAKIARYRKMRTNIRSMSRDDIYKIIYPIVAALTPKEMRYVNCLSAKNASEYAEAYTDDVMRGTEPDWYTGNDLADDVKRIVENARESVLEENENVEDTIKRVGVVRYVALHH